MFVSRKAFHWQPVRSTKKIASIAARSIAARSIAARSIAARSIAARSIAARSIAARSGTRGLWQPRGCFGRGGSSGSIFAHSASGKRQPSSQTRRFVGFRSVLVVMDQIWASQDRIPTGVGSKSNRLLGVAVRLAGVIAVLFTLHLWIGRYNDPTEWPWTYVAIICAHGMFAATEAGRSLGLDNLLRGQWSGVFANRQPLLRAYRLVS